MSVNIIMYTANKNVINVVLFKMLQLLAQKYKGSPWYQVFETILNHVHWLNEVRQQTQYEMKFPCPQPIISIAMFQKISDQ